MNTKKRRLLGLILSVLVLMLTLAAGVTTAYADNDTVEVSFDTDGLYTIPETQVIPVNGKASRPANPTWNTEANNVAETGLHFQNWFTKPVSEISSYRELNYSASDGGCIFGFSDTQIAENTTVYAGSWCILNLATYDPTNETSGPSGGTITYDNIYYREPQIWKSNSTTGIKDTKATLTANPTSGYVFAGWSSSKSESDIFSTEPTYTFTHEARRTIYALFEKGDHVHKWDDGRITIPATCTTEGKKIFTCTICDTTKERTIPVDPNAHNYGAWTKLNDKQHQRVCSRDKNHIEKANHTWNNGKCSVCGATGDKPTGNVTILNTIANSAKKQNDVIWDKSKVKGATNYEINWRAKGSKNWASKTVGNTVRGTTTGLAIKGLYEIRVRPKNAAGVGAWSNTVYRYFHTTEKIRLKSASKGSFTMSWKNNPQATSYQVMFTTNKNGSGAAKNINNIAKGKTSFTKTGLKSGKTYYVQVREMRKVGNTTYVGNISCPVAVKVK